MEGLQPIFILLFAAVLLVGIAQKMHIPYPIALVVGGAIISFFPGLSTVTFNPEIILLIVLPPILYYAAFGTAFKEFQKNWQEIFSLALGLVICTTVVMALLFKWMFPDYSWALAFAFGAIISPPDAVAATTILKRFAINSRLISILEGESLVNDASALVLYKLAVIALFYGSFSLSEGVVQFIQIVAGGIGVGAIIGLIVHTFSNKYLEPVLGVVLSFTIPYVTYIIASVLNVSGVLAVVVNGLIGSRMLLKHHSSLRRVLGYATWDIFTILLNCFVFILIGLQLRSIVSMMTIYQMATYFGYAVIITIATIAIRMLWAYAMAGISCAKGLYTTRTKALNSKCMREAALIGWSGMRGIVSLAVAIALPFTLSNGEPLAGRNEVIFITFSVILLSLLIPGLTLPYIIQKLKIRSMTEAIDENKIRKHLVELAQEKLNQFLHSKTIDSKEFEFLNNYFISHHQALAISHKEDNKKQNLEETRLKVIQAQRKELIALWEKREIDDNLLTHLENELDLVEVHIARGILK
ncbi:MAG: Na+/H+ antiporter [Parachlamydiales bacterium]|jgi:CPA1 family monovalent cation:H+ antiporter